MTSGLRYHLTPPEREAEFRASALHRDRRVTVVLALFTAAFEIAVIPSEHSLLGPTAALNAIVAVNLAVVAASLALVMLVRRVQSVARYDAFVTAWGAVFFAGIVATNAILPADYTDFVAWDVFICVLAYAALPVAFFRQVTLGVGLALGDLAVLALTKTTLRPATVSDITLAFVCANLVGGFVALDVHRWRRREFTSLRAEQMARQALEEALHEIHTLRGIIPICSYCKNVRTDAGDWQKVEAYVREHSDAQFSHGVCPSCLARHFPDIGTTGEHGTSRHG